MNEFYDKLDELYAAGDLGAVEAFMRSTIDDTDENSAIRAGLYNELAGFYRGVSRFAESESVFKQSLGIFESIGMGATPEFATVLLNLAGLYRIMGDADKAIELFIDAKKKLEDAEASESYAYISVLNNLALAYQARLELVPALEYAGRALELMRAGGGGGHEIASSLNNLASIRFQLGELDAADTLISEALQIYDGMDEPDVHHAAALATKAAIMCRLGDYKGALQGFQQALGLTRRFFGENIEYAICRRNTSEVFELLGDVPSAIEELSDAVRIMEQIRGSDHPSVTDAKAKLAKLRDGARA
ncbi:MAG: tetratricopeptide repeat protein [Oscillospiraceae bacterium]|nr:tetratricopeptide repeat protein [Oscillospiraceae bacterium]